MEVLREISQLSTYKPKNGLKKELYRLTIIEGRERKQAAEIFEKDRKKGHFDIVYKQLKKVLLDGVAKASLSKIPQNQVKRIRLWKRHLQIKMLMAVGKKKAGIKLAIQAVINAEKGEDFVAMLSISKILTAHYSLNDFDKAKYIKYKNKFDKAISFLHDENLAEGYFLDLTYRRKAKLNLDHIPEQIKELDQIAQNNTNFKFRYFYYILKTIYYQSTLDHSNFISCNKSAYQFFDTQKHIPYQMKFNFLIDVVPTFILKGMYKEANGAIARSLELVPEHSQNWHKTLIYKAFLGLWSGTPLTALSAYKIAHSVPRQFDSNAIDENWHLLKGYLMVYAKLGIIPPVQKPFRLKSWVNVVDKRGDDATKANRLIIEALYYLADKKRATFFETTEKIGHAMNKRFKEHRFSRTRVFFRALKCITKGNYHPVLATAYAKRYIKQLRDTNDSTDSKRLEVEMVGYLDLWELVLNNLQK